ASAVMTADLANGSLHEILREADFVLRRGTGTISAAAASAEDARLLGVRLGDPLLVGRPGIVGGAGRAVGGAGAGDAGGRYGLEVQFDVEGAAPETMEPRS